MKKQNGITLIALVITIIVLLILAGVSIAMLTGDNGILTKAKSANEQNKEAEIKEALSLATSTIIADQIDPTVEIKPTLNADTLAKQIAKDNANSNAIQNGQEPDEILYTYGGKQYVVSFTWLPESEGSTTYIGIDFSKGITIDEKPAS